MKKYDIDKNLIVCTIAIDDLKKYFVKRNLKYKKTSHYPGIKRDISIIVKSKHKNIELENDIYSNGGKYLININLFDYYIDKKIGGDKKSLAYSLEFKSNNRTLNDTEISFQMDEIIASLVEKFSVIQK